MGTGGKLRPQTGPAWFRWVEGELGELRLRVRRLAPPPVGQLILYAGSTTRMPPGWLVANGGAFTGDDYPRLRDQLGGSTTLPNPAAPSGLTYLIRAE